MRILELALLFEIVFACEWLESIKEKNVYIKLIGTGLHRKLSVKTKLASINRFAECRILYELTIPSGAYVEINSVNSSLFEHSFHTIHQFDVEKPESESNAHNVLVLAALVLRKSFVLSDELELPVHLRYHSAGSEPATIKFQTPKIAIDCKDDYKTFELRKCPGQRKYENYGIPSEAPNWILVEPLPKITVEAKIPVADVKWTLPVVIVTLIVLVIGMLMIFTSK